MMLTVELIVDLRIEMSRGNLEDYICTDLESKFRDYREFLVDI